MGVEGAETDTSQLFSHYHEIIKWSSSDWELTVADSITILKKMKIKQLDTCPCAETNQRREYVLYDRLLHQGYTTLLREKKNCTWWRHLRLTAYYLRNVLSYVEIDWTRKRNTLSYNVLKYATTNNKPTAYPLTAASNTFLHPVMEISKAGKFVMSTSCIDFKVISLMSSPTESDKIPLLFSKQMMYFCWMHADR